MTPDYDVFLSFLHRDADLARRVEGALSAAGLRFFSGSSGAPGKSLERLWEVLAESAALVVITTGKLMGSNTLAEIGAAMAWQKPIYVLTDGAGDLDLAFRSHQLRVYRIEQLNEVVRVLTEAARPISSRERLLLAKIYRRLKIPTDELTRRPAALDKLTAEFNRVARKNMAGEVLVRELLRLRKRGALPSLGQRNKQKPKALHVVPRTGGWAVVSSGRDRAQSIHPNRAAAIDAARDIAVRHSSDVLVHAKDGRIVGRDSYGPDPTPPRDVPHAGRKSSVKVSGKSVKRSGSNRDSSYVRREGGGRLAITVRSGGRVAITDRSGRGGSGRARTK